MEKIMKAVIPVAGLGTRFLPATKAQPKEMLPLVDKPVIQYVVEEAIHAGVENIILVTGRGKTEELEEVQRITRLGQFAYVRQGEPLGLGHAVLCAHHAVGHEPFALLLGDDVFDEADPALGALLEAFEATGKSVVGVQEVPLAHVSRYGIVNPPGPKAGPWWEVAQIVEKPAPNEAPSRWAVVGRYVLKPEIFKFLQKVKPGVGGEYQLTDALAALANEGELVAAPIPARRYDTGDKLDYLKANVEFGLKREDLGGPFLAYLKELVADR